MSEPRNGLRYGLLGLIVLVLVAGLAFFVSRPTTGITPAEAAETPATPAPTAQSATPAPTGLQTLAEVAAKAPSHRTLDIQQWKTAEGARVLFVEAHELPMFDLRLTFAAGSSQDGDVPGVAMLTNAMLNEGVPGKDTNAIAAGFEDLGADFSNGSYRDMAVAGLRSLSDPAKRDPALKLFDQVIGQPSFPQDALARIKNQVLAGFEYQKQNPGKLAGLALFQHLYGNHPYAHSSDGDEHSVPKISAAQLRAFHQKAYAAGNVVIAIVGDLKRDEAQAMAAQVSAALPKGPALAALAEPQVPKAGVTHIEFPSKQTHLLLAQLGITRNDPDYAALYLGNQILGGGGFGTRLMDQVREKRGLTYGVYSGFTGMQARGPFTISLQTRAELSEGTLKLVQDIVRDYLANGPTQKELDDAKRELAGSFPLSTASNGDIVGQLGAIGFYNLPSDYLENFLTQVQALSVEQVKAAMARHLNADGFVVVTAGPTVEQKPIPAASDKPVEQPLGVPEH
ncbi:MAG: putative zinc protease [Pseudomonas citronellolis]|nr:MAG: putative zinc protease [Pseudomonas citronellolis]